MNKQKGSVGASLFGVLFVVGLLTLITSIRMVGVGRVGVVTQYGKVTGRELNEGLSFVAPWGINKVAKYDVKTQKHEVKSSAATNDLQDVSSTLVINYRLNSGDVSKMHRSVGKKYEDRVVTPVIDEVFKATTAKYTASELITKRSEVKIETTKALQDRLNKRGITIEDVNIISLEFSKAFNEAIEAVQIANRNVERERQELEATKIKAEREIAAAKGAAEAQRLQEQTLTSKILQKLAIEKWSGDMPTYYGGGGMLFNIPIEK